MGDRILSLFIDESGDFGAYDVHTPYYIVAMILHDQDVDIKDKIRQLDKHMTESGFDIHAIHTGPLIRREAIYSNEIMESRKKLFNILFHFSRQLDFKYICPMIKKSECHDVITMTGKLSKAIKNELVLHQDYWESFDKVIVYYDNGQVELTKILSSVFNVLYADVEFRKVQPVDYKLFQVADMVCTLELLRLKAENNSFSKSETEFFNSVRDFRKNYLKTLVKKHL